MSKNPAVAVLLSDLDDTLVRGVRCSSAPGVLAQARNGTPGSVWSPTRSPTPGRRSRRLDGPRSSTLVT